jgi:Holliday junction resolvasome RuvABC endonuclease subunit
VGEVIAGFDTALWRTGWAVVRQDRRQYALLGGGGIGCGRKTGKDARASALAELLARTECILAANHPDIVVVEKPGKWARASWRSSQAAVEAMAEARGVVVAVAGGRGIPCEELEVGVARGRVLGSSGAGKERVVFAIRALGLPILELEDGTPDLDYCDAALLAVALRWEDGLTMPASSAALRTRSHGT